MFERAAIVIAVFVIWLAEGNVLMRIERTRPRFSMRAMFLAMTVLLLLLLLASLFE